MYSVQVLTNVHPMIMCALIVTWTPVGGMVHNLISRLAFATITRASPPSRACCWGEVAVAATLLSAVECLMCKLHVVCVCVCVQVLLRWVLQYGVAAVCEAAGKEIDRANVGVFEWELKPADFKKLSDIKPS